MYVTQQGSLLLKDRRGWSYYTKTADGIDQWTGGKWYTTDWQLVVGDLGAEAFPLAPISQEPFAELIAEANVKATFTLPQEHADIPEEPVEPGMYAAPNGLTLFKDENGDWTRRMYPYSEEEFWCGEIYHDMDDWRDITRTVGYGIFPLKKIELEDIIQFATKQQDKEQNITSNIFEEPEPVGLYLTQDGRIVSNDEYGYWKLRTQELAWNDPVADLDEQHYDTDFWEDFVEEHLHARALPLVQITPEMLANACLQVVHNRQEENIEEFINQPFSSALIFQQLINQTRNNRKD
ncbi:hypothetical protein GCM10007377_15860 [Galliscardovia ingluviei]|uniref:Uncharacterized protein n=2 Tax=Galliscardovia ingluviei TaxID=1769422 RepID=A0A8J3AKB4_9BIFI|nr:hypothetical protein GCM10007377_15860 [Galliscardovia ingluviei]